jgi:hypothetical protein
MASLSLLGYSKIVSQFGPVINKAKGIGVGNISDKRVYI